MAVTNNISVILDLLILIGRRVLHGGSRLVQLPRKDLNRAEKSLRAGAWLIGLWGCSSAIFAIWAEMTFPLTSFGSSSVYNVFFFDPLLMLSFLAVSFAALIVFGSRPTTSGSWARSSVCAVIYYGVHAYLLGLSDRSRC